MKRLKIRLKDQRGASLVEYALLVMLIAVVCMTSLRNLGEELREEYTVTAQTIAGSGGGAGGDFGGFTTDPTSAGASGTVQGGGAVRPGGGG